MASVERRLERAIHRSPLGRVVEPARAVRFAEYVLVGLSGAVIDLAITASLFPSVHYLLANAAGFLVANSWNFGLNHRVTFDSPEGSRARQYAAYLGWHSTTFAVRASVLLALVEAGGVPILAASAVGIGAAAIANFAGAELIFGTATVSGRGLRARGGRALNSVVHRLYTPTVRRLLDRSGLYPPLYGAYQWLLGRIYAGEQAEVEIAGAQTVVHTERDDETLSVFHTLRKEEAMLEDFVGSLQSDDVVWDVGANLGIFSLLAADVVDEVVAIEPFAPTAERLQENVELAEPPAPVHVAQLALGDSPGQVSLALEREEVGTQTPSVGEESEGVTVRQALGDDLVAAGELPAPDVLKIDVEGAELAALDGLLLTLQECRLVYVEDHSGLWGGRGESGLERRLEAAGFDVEVLEQGGQTYYRGERQTV